MEKDRKEAITTYLLGVKAKDELSLEKLYAEIAPTIRYIALKYLKNACEADDLAQDFWSEIYTFADDFFYFQNAFSYLCKIMTRMAINRYKVIHRENCRKTEFVDYEFIRQDDENAVMEQIEFNLSVELALKELTENESIVIQLTYFEDKTIRDIAKELKISKTQANNIKLCAIEKMKKKFFFNFVDKDLG